MTSQNSHTFGNGILSRAGEFKLALLPYFDAPVDVPEVDPKPSRLLFFFIVA